MLGVTSGYFITRLLSYQTQLVSSKCFELCVTSVVYNTGLSEAEERIICSGNDVFVTVKSSLKDYAEFLAINRRKYRSLCSVQRLTYTFLPFRWIRKKFLCLIFLLIKIKQCINYINHNHSLLCWKWHRRKKSWKESIIYSETSSSIHVFIS